MQYTLTVIIKITEPTKYPELVGSILHFIHYFPKILASEQG